MPTHLPTIRVNHGGKHISGVTVTPYQIYLNTLIQRCEFDGGSQFLTVGNDQTIHISSPTELNRASPPSEVIN
jgi:hypothetical protein